MNKLDRRIERSKRSGKLAAGVVLMVSVVFAAPLIQGLLLAIETGRRDPVLKGLVGLGLLVALNVFSLVLTRRQHRMLDEAREELEGMVRGDLPL